MRYFFVLIMLLAGSLTQGPARAQAQDPHQAYERKIKEYLFCVELHFRKNASTIGNTIEAAQDAQQSCQTLYDEIITTATSNNGPVDIIRDVMEGSKKYAPRLMMRELSTDVQNLLNAATEIQVMLDHCPIVDRATPMSLRDSTLAAIAQYDARYKVQGRAQDEMRALVKKAMPRLVQPDGSPRPELKQWCAEQVARVQSVPSATPPNQPSQ